MKYPHICLIGATGKTGKEVLKTALDRGYQVTVLARTPSKLGEFQNRVRVVQGDGTDSAAVASAVRGCGAVISVIGPTKNSKPGMQPEVTRNIVEAMQKEGIRRLITMTGAGVRVAGDTPKFADKLIVAVMKVVALKALKDGKEHAEVVAASDLDWTVVRAPMLKDEPAKGEYKTGMVGQSHMSTQISRADAAAFILDELENCGFIQQYPMVSW